MGNPCKDFPLHRRVVLGKAKRNKKREKFLFSNVIRSEAYVSNDKCIIIISIFHRIERKFVFNLRQ